MAGTAEYICPICYKCKIQSDSVGIAGAGWIKMVIFTASLTAWFDIVPFLLHPECTASLNAQFGIIPFLQRRECLPLSVSFHFSKANTDADHRGKTVESF